MRHLISNQPCLKIALSSLRQRPIILAQLSTQGGARAPLNQKVNECALFILHEVSSLGGAMHNSATRRMAYEEPGCCSQEGPYRMPEPTFCCTDNNKLRARETNDSRREPHGFPPGWAELRPRPEQTFSLSAMLLYSTENTSDLPSPFSFCS